MSILVVSVSQKSTSVAHLGQLALDPGATTKLADQLVRATLEQRLGSSIDVHEPPVAIDPVDGIGDAGQHVGRP